MTGALDALLRRGPRLLPGHVWLAGAGSGDPGCPTLDVAAALGRAEAVVHDALVSEGVLALLPPAAQRILAGKRGRRPSAPQGEITATLIALARAGRRVLRLEGGDPLVFGRGAEEAAALAEAGVPFRVLPGLTAGLVGFAAAAVPATVRSVNQALVLATGHGADSAAEGPDWAALARAREPIVLHMATRTLPRIAAALVEGGLPPETPAAVVASATLPERRVLVSALAEVAGEARRHGVQPPAVAAIGAIVAVRERPPAAAAQAVAAQ